MKKILTWLIVSMVLVISCDKETPVSSVSLNTTSITLTIGETTSLSATVLPDNATDKSLTWTSSNASVATVSNGLVTAVSVGSATISVSSVDGKSANCQVTVNPIEVESISLDASAIDIKVGESRTLTATVKPANATNKTVYWASSNESVATVSNGVVTAISPGKASIIASADRGGTDNTKAAIHEIYTSCQVTVSPVAVSSISLDKTSAELHVGEAVQLTASILPENATDKAISWVSSNNTIASVTDGGLVIAQNIGDAVISAITHDGGKYASCRIKVSPISVQGVSLSSHSLTLKLFSAGQLTATVSPANATNAELIWSSSNTSIVTVSDYGLIRTLSTGTAVITVTTVDGGKTDSCVVTVENSMTGGNEDINEGESQPWK